MNQLKVQGIYAGYWATEWSIAFKEMAQWIQEVRGVGISYTYDLIFTPLWC